MSEDGRFNEQILKEIAHLRKLQEAGVYSERITHVLEMLRVVRNTVLDQSFHEGFIQENEWIERER